MADTFLSSVSYTAVTAWAASTAYSIGDIRRPTAAAAGNERVYRCTTAGTSSGTQPTWNLGKGTTTNDGSVVWTEITGSPTYNSVTNFAAPHARIEQAVAAGWLAAGDWIYASSDHAEAGPTNADITITFPGTASAPNVLLSINKTTGAVAAGAKITSSGNAFLTVQGSHSTFGVTLECASGSSAGRSLRLMTSASGNIETWNNCTLSVLTTSALGGIEYGDFSNTANRTLILNDCTLNFSNAGHTFSVWGALHINGGALAGSAITQFMTEAKGRHSTLARIKGFDFSAAASSLNLTLGGSHAAYSEITFENCKMPASWSGGLTSSTLTSPGVSVVAQNCSAGADNNFIRHTDMFGRSREETTLVMTGGATNGTTPYSMRIITESPCLYPAARYISLPIMQWNELTGSAKTVTVEILHDSVTNLTDADIQLRLEYLGNASFPVSTFINDGPATVVTTPTDQTASSQTWTTTGMTNPNKQKLSVSLTPNMKGLFRAHIIVFKPSKTLYYNPEIIVT